jgi:hypothetical protein
MTTISLKDFILHGKFGDVTIGMTKNEVVKILGKPRQEQGDFLVDFGMAYYNGFEIFYWDGKIHGIQNDHLDSLFVHSSIKTRRLSKKAKINVSLLLFGKAVTYKNTIEHLNQENIKFDIHKNQRDGYYELKFESGVKFDFKNWIDENDYNDLLINGIRYIYNYD